MAGLAFVTLVGFLCLAGVAYRRLPHVATVLLLVLFYLYTFHAYATAYLGVEGYLVNAPPYYTGGAPHDVAIDDAFWQSIALLGVFANTYLLALIALAGVAREARPTPLAARPGRLLLLGIVALGGAILMWVTTLLQALSSGVSAYIVFKSGGTLGVWYPVSRILFDVASMSIGGAVGLLVRPDAVRRGVVLVLAIGAAGTLALTMALLGDRATLAGGLAFGVMVALHHRPIRVARVLAFGALALAAVNVVGVLRERTAPRDDELPIALQTISGLIVNGEAATSLSMYSTLRYDIPQSNGQALAFVAETMVPRFIRPDREAVDSYQYYADAIGLADGTGWGLLLPADLFINFGFAGLVLGAVALGSLHAYFFRQYRRRPEILFAFAGLIASFPVAFRAGIPGVKGALFGILAGYLLGRVAASGAHGMAHQT